MKRVKLTKMKVKIYKFGNMNILPDKNGKWIPQTDVDLILEDEKGIINMWNSNKKRLNRERKKLIKIYENDLEIDITPKEELEEL